MNNELKPGRAAYAGEHRLAKGISFPCDTWETGLNNNVLVIGPSGSGKTRGYVTPNILGGHESLIVSDTKGLLVKRLGPELEKRGYKLINIDFTDLAGMRERGSIGYNPLDYIRYDEVKKRYNEQDILSLTACIVPLMNGKEPFWDFAARQFLSVIIAYVLECLPDDQHNFAYVHKTLTLMGDRTSDDFEKLMHEADVTHPSSSFSERYRAIRNIMTAEKMYLSILGIISTALSTLCIDEALALYSSRERICFEELGKRKTAVFLTVSDMDRSMDALVNAFMTQALQFLIRSADKDYPDSRLPIPVRLYLDDFATNYRIPDFDNTISVIRSREIYVSIILQSITQLDSLYGHARGRTIINNCDSLLYLGGQDLETAHYISERSDLPLQDIISMPINRAFVLRRGSIPTMAEKCS